MHLHLEQIEVKAKHSKTRRHRLVPISKNLAQWLMPYRQPSGPIGYSRRAFRAAYQAAAIENWKQDVLRHSYGTHRLPILKSAEALALEMGNSPDIIFRHYRRPMAEQTGLEYFSIVPPNAPNDPTALKHEDSDAIA